MRSVTFAESDASSKSVPLTDYDGRWGSDDGLRRYYSSGIMGDEMGGRRDGESELETRKAIQG